MLKFVSVLALLVAVASANSVPRHRYQENAMRINGNRQPRGGRIVGGSDSRIEDFPYQISLRFNGRNLTAYRLNKMF
jgi:hypothetical protein